LNSVSRSLFATVWERWNIGGELHFGSLSIEVYPSSGGLTVDILDTKTGEQTQEPKQQYAIIQLLHHTTLLIISGLWSLL
jgi:hypothetical protein